MSVSTKSRRDVEAALAIAQLANDWSRQADDRTISGPGTWSKPRFSHMRAAVMPQTCSRVQRAAAKRKYDTFDEQSPVNSAKYACLEDTVEPVHRDTFLAATRAQHVARTDEELVGRTDQELVGRFVRTCDVGDDVSIEQQLSVSPRLVSSVPSLLNTASRRRQHQLTVDKCPVLSADSLSRLSLPQDHPGAVYCRDVTRCYVLPQDHLSGHGALKCVEGDRRSSSLLSAYYSLGQSAAAAAASQLLMMKPEPPSSLSQSQSVVKSCQSHGVDSRTMDKVRRGQFGALSTLRLYCSQLRRHSEPERSADAAAAADADVAVDLSVRRHTVCSADDVAKYRTSRSSGRSPAHHRITSVSLPSSPYVSCHDDRLRSHDDEDVMSDRCLPLKKRRLHYHHDNQQQQQQQQQPDDDNDCDNECMSVQSTDVNRLG